MPFDPTKPYEVVSENETITAPKFDPSKPYDVISEDELASIQGPAQGGGGLVIPEQEGGILRQAAIGAEQGINSLGASVYGGAEAAANLIRKIPGGKYFAPSPQSTTGLRQSAQQRSAELESTGQITEGPGFVRKLASGATSLAPALVAGSVSFPSAVVAAGLQSFGSTYGDAIEGYKEQGLTEEEAANKAFAPAIGSGLITSALTFAGGKTGAEAIKSLQVSQPFKQAAISFFKEAGLEATEEGVDQLAQGAIAKFSYNPKLTWQDALKQSAEAAVLGGVLGGAASGVGRASQAIDNRLNPQSTAQANPEQNVTTDSEFTPIPITGQGPEIQVEDPVVAQGTKAAANIISKATINTPPGTELGADVVKANAAKLVQTAQITESQTSSNIPSDPQEFANYLSNLPTRKIRELAIERGIPLTNSDQFYDASVSSGAPSQNAPAYVNAIFDDIQSWVDNQTLQPEVQPDLLQVPQQPRVETVEVNPQTQSQAQTPIGTGKVRESQAYQKVLSRLQEETQDVPTYNQLNLANDTTRALDFLDSNPDQSNKIALGLINPPENITETAISIAASEKALSEGNYKLAAQLESSRSLRQTRRGQEIVAERGRFNPNSPQTFIKQILDARKKKQTKYIFNSKSETTSNQVLTEKLSNEAKAARKQINKRAAKIQSAQDIINSILC